jgi:hypothetical protein
MVLTANVFQLVFSFAVITSHPTTDILAHCLVFPITFYLLPSLTQTRGHNEIIDQ